MILLSERHFYRFCCEGALFFVAVLLGELCKAFLSCCSGAGIKGTKQFMVLFFFFEAESVPFHGCYM